MTRSERKGLNGEGTAMEEWSKVTLMPPSDTNRDVIAVWGKRRTDWLGWVEDATDSLKAAVREAVAAGMTESEAARLAGVTRPTIRKWLGKDRQRSDA